MADIKTYLAEQGLTPEEIAAVVGNEKTTKAMTAALAKYDEGLSLSAKAQTDLETAQREKSETQDFYDKTILPGLSGADKKIATANSEAARYKAYLQSLKDQGYDVPADLLTAPANPNPVNPNPTNGNFLSQEEFKKEMLGVGPTLVSLMSLSNEFQDLHGKPYLTADEDFAEAQKTRKPFREFVKDKYKFEEKRKEKLAAAEQLKVNAMVDEKYKVKEAELQAKYGANPETRAPLASKFDKIEKLAERKDSWKSSAGRDASRKNRLSKFENVTLQ